MPSTGGTPYHQQTEKQAAAVRHVQRLAAVKAELLADSERELATAPAQPSPTAAEKAVASLLESAIREVTEDSRALIDGWPAVAASYSGDEQVKGKELRARQPATRLSTAFDSVTLYGRDPGESPDVAEAGADPISQLAFTLANAFTYVEAYLARGMKVDDFAPSLSFFFSNGMDQRNRSAGPSPSSSSSVANGAWQ